MLLFCIDRDNPWDPYNGCNPYEELPKLQGDYKSWIEALMDSLTLYNDSVFQWSRLGFTNRINGNNGLQNNNLANLNQMDSIRGINEQIDKRNSTAGSCDSMESKLLISPDFPDLLSRIYPFNTNAIDSYLQTLQNGKKSIEALIDEAQQKCPKMTVLSAGYSDSVLAFFPLNEDQWTSLINGGTIFNAQVDSANKIIDSINRVARFLDSITGFFNDSLKRCQLPWIDDTAGIQQRIDSILPGGTIALRMDSVHIKDFYFKGKGASGKTAVIMGNPLTKTIISSNRVHIDSSSMNIRFENLIFTDNSDNVGAQVTNYADNIAFSNCIFRDNALYGFYADNCGNVHIDNCVFLRNGGGKGDGIEQGGMRISNCRGMISAVNILVARNTGFGIDITSTYVTVLHGTISDNTLHGVQYVGPTSTGQFQSDSSIFSFNGQYGLYRNDQQTTRDIWVAADHDNWFFANGSGALGGDPKMIIDNPLQSADPMFIDRENGNFHIGPASPLYGRAIGYQYP